MRCLKRPLLVQREATVRTWPDKARLKCMALANVPQVSAYHPASPARITSPKPFLMPQ